MSKRDEFEELEARVPLETAEDHAFRKSVQTQPADTFVRGGAGGQAAGFGACAACVRGQHRECTSKSCSCVCRTHRV